MRKGGKGGSARAKRFGRMRTHERSGEPKSAFRAASSVEEVRRSLLDGSGQSESA